MYSRSESDMIQQESPSLWGPGKSGNAGCSVDCVVGGRRYALCLQGYSVSIILYCSTRCTPYSIWQQAGSDGWVLFSNEQRGISCISFDIRGRSRREDGVVVDFALALTSNPLKDILTCPTSDPFSQQQPPPWSRPSDLSFSSPVRPVL